MEYRVTGSIDLYPLLREMKRFDMERGEEYRVNIFELSILGENNNSEAIQFAGMQALDILKSSNKKKGNMSRYLPEDVLVKGEISPGLVNLLNVKMKIGEKQILIENDKKSRVLYL